MRENQIENKNRMSSRRWNFFAVGAVALIVAGVACSRDGYNFERRDDTYPLHENIKATEFWVGEPANESNDHIDNISGAWNRNWVETYGGIDDPTNRCGYQPCDFIPLENPFYFALPFGDHDKRGLKSQEVLSQIPWYENEVAPYESLLKNRWIRVMYDDKTAYAQWEDVGPYYNDDAEYVFGDNDDLPRSDRAGLDMSPALDDYLGTNGRADVSWQFVEATEVEAGPWTEIITTSGPDYSGG